MAGKHSNGGYEFALAEALGTLGTGPEPPMPDLLSGAIAQGTRIRRRRRIGVALGSAAMAAVVAVGGYGVLSPTPESRRSLPAAEPTVWYPSLKLLRSIVPPETGTVENAQPQGSRRPATYFRLTDPRTGLVSDLYVSVARSTTGLSPLPQGPAACRDGHGRELSTPWGGRPFKCSTVRTGSGNSLLQFYVRKEDLPARMRKGATPTAWGLSRVTTGGWTVQVIVSPQDGTPQNPEVTTPNWPVLTDLVTDSRVFDAVEEPGD